MEAQEQDGRFRRFVPVRLRSQPASERPNTRQRLAQVAAAAAVLICLVGAWGVVRNPFGESAVHPGPRVDSASVGDGSDSQRPGQMTARQSPRPVPRGFTLWTVTPAGKNRLVALGGVPCGHDVCPATLSSRDAGRQWQVTHTFAHTDTSAMQGSAQPSIQPPGALSGVAFVNDRIGYVFGGDLWMTTDAGASFIRIAHPGSTVLDVAVRGQEVHVLTAENCVQGSCAGRLLVSRLTPGRQTTMPSPIAGVTPASTVFAASLAQSADSLLVLAQGAPGSNGNAPGAWRLGGSSLVGLPVSGLCHGNSVLAAAAASSGPITALCDATATATSTAYSTVSGAANGAIWALRGSGNVVLPTQGRVDLATQDGTHLVASSGGPRTAVDGTNRVAVGTALSVSTDGGRTWEMPRRPPRDASAGFDAVIATGPHDFVAVSRQSSSFWRSHDDGVTWDQVSVHGSGG